MRAHRVSLWSLLLLACVAGLAPGCRLGRAEEPPEPLVTTLERADVVRLQDVARQHLLAVRTCEQTRARGLPPALRSACDRTLGELRVMGDDLHALAVLKNIALVTTLDAASQRRADALAVAPAQALAHDYLAHRLEADRQRLRTLQRLLGETRDEDLRAFAVKHQPLLSARIAETEALERGG